MSLTNSIILGIVQGLTEFLPISSSGHLVLFQNILGLQEAGVTLEVLLHFGTLLSIVWVFRRDFADLLQFKKDHFQRRFMVMLLTGTAVTAVIAFILRPFVLRAFKSALAVGFLLLITGTILWAIKFIPVRKKTVASMNFLDAVWVGIFQGFAVFPGISRSGSTIVGALWRGLDRPTSVRFSFILASPAILGAALLEARHLYLEGVTGTLMLNYITGTLCAFVFGVAAIKIFMRLLQNQKFHFFSIYCWAAGIFTIIMSLK